MVRFVRVTGGSRDEIYTLQKSLRGERASRKRNTVLRMWLASAQYFGSVGTWGYNSKTKSCVVSARCMFLFQSDVRWQISCEVTDLLWGDRSLVRWQISCEVTDLFWGDRSLVRWQISFELTDLLWGDRSLVYSDQCCATFLHSRHTKFCRSHGGTPTPFRTFEGGWRWFMALIGSDNFL
jgi:hypothetical protein